MDVERNSNFKHGHFKQPFDLLCILGVTILVTAYLTSVLYEPPRHT
jgi:hypothetical protein